MKQQCTVESPLGRLYLAAEGEALVSLCFEGQRFFTPPEQAEIPSPEPLCPVLRQTKDWLTLYFAGIRPDFTPALNPQGTPFRKEVWRELLTVPYGHTVTYGELADRIAGVHGIPKMSAQAVGGAVGHNPIAILIPCHRVMGAGNSLTGYGGGLWRKETLLRLEGYTL